MAQEQQQTELLLEPGHSETREKTWLNNLIYQIKNDPISWGIILSITFFFVFFLVVPLAIIVIDGFKFHAVIQLFSDKQFFDPLGSREEYFIRIAPEQKYVINPDTGKRERLTVAQVIFLRGPDRGIFLNTLIIGILTTFVSATVGILTAFIMARVDFYGKRIISGLLLVPLVLPPFVGGVGYQAIAGKEGLLNEEVLKPLFGIKIVFEGLFAIIFVQSLHYFALIYLNVYSSLMNVDPSLEEQAENLGASDFQRIKDITLPLAMPGISSGSILVFILSMEDLGTPIIFGGFGDNVAKKTITFYIANHIYVGFTTKTIYQESIVLGAFLLLFAIIGFIFIRKFVSLRQYSMISKGRGGTFRTYVMKIKGHILVYLYFILLLGIATIPHIGVILGSMTKAGQFPLVYTDEFYRKLFFSSETGSLTRYIKNTLVYSAFATTLIIILATLAGYVANRKKFVGQSAFDTLITVPIAIPGVVLGIGYMAMFINMGSFNIKLFGTTLPLTFNPLIYPPIILVISYTIRRFPFTVRAVYAGLQQTDEVLEESAINLGASKYRVVFEIIVPIILLNIVAGALIALVYIMGEVSTTLILVQDSTYGTITWKMADLNGKLGELAAIGVFLMALQIVSLLITNLLLQNRAEAMTGI